MSDLELLQAYARTNSQSAFSALVERHVNLVYSAAQRQVRSSQLAEEIAQSVFIDLARNADRFPPTQPLAPWLFLVTRRTAVDVIRRESRRQARERAAAEMDAMKTPSATWPLIKDRLDEAMESLNDVERAALLLRFFENRSLREVGASLGISEDTAQKRVSRALDRLRAHFVRRGVAVSSVGLAADLSAHAIQAAPFALSSTVAAATTGAAGSVIAAPGASLPIAFTALPKALAVAVVAGAIGFAAYETQALVRQREDLTSTRARLAQNHSTVLSLRSAQNAAAGELQQAREILSGLVRLRSTDPEVEAAIEGWLRRLERLKALTFERPELNIPELAVLTDEVWFTAARDATLESETEIQATFRTFHQTARKSVAHAFSRALIRYADAHEGRLPTHPTQLAPYFEPRVPPSLFTHYEMLQTGSISAVPDEEWILAERLTAAPTHGGRAYVSRRKYGVEELSAVSDDAFRSAVRAFVAEHHGELPTHGEQLLRYLGAPPPPAAAKALLEKPASDFAPERLRTLLRAH